MITSAMLAEIPGLVHAFGTRENPAPLGRERMPQWKQVHGAAFAEACAPDDKLGDIDALWSASPDVTIGVVTADCVPVLLARRDGARVAAIHAGWRGTKARIVRKLWEHLAARGERAEDWVAAIGPAIGGCCYQVDEALAEDFAREFGPLVPREAILPAPRMLDLPPINEAELRALGFRDVDRLSFCTLCSRDSRGTPLFYSYRASPGEGRQLSQIRATAPRSGSR